jgi:hypothetical protein
MRSVFTCGAGDVAIPAVVFGVGVGYPRRTASGRMRTCEPATAILPALLL